MQERGLKCKKKQNIKHFFTKAVFVQLCFVKFNSVQQPYFLVYILHTCMFFISVLYIDVQNILKGQIHFWSEFNIFLITR